MTNRRFLRQCVRAFSAGMVAKLIAHEHKGIIWRDDDPRDLLRRLDDEVAELRRAVNGGSTIEEIGDPYGRWSRTGADGPRRYRLGATLSIDAAALAAIQAEAADVANFAMMIADRCALLAAVFPTTGT